MPWAPELFSAPVLSVDEIGGIQRAEEVAAAEA
jgi:hypothetical protein